MAAEKSPAFQFYPKEFLMDGNVSGMSLQELGAYIKLLCICWQDGNLPSDPRRLANMVGVPYRAFVKLWPALNVCFRDQAPDRLIHPRLEKERDKQEAYRNRQSDKGRAGAGARWPKHVSVVAQALAQAIPLMPTKTDDAKPSVETFTEDELHHAAALRSSVTPAQNIRRRDRCPHRTPCPNTRVCIEEIAWYLRHQREIEGAA